MPVAIVTGASRGIGRAIALQLADDAMDIALNDVQSQLSEVERVRDEIQAKGKLARRKAAVFIADVSDESQVMKMTADVVAEFGQLNVMVANAGIIVPKPILEVSVDEWDRVQRVNVRGAFLCYREAAKQMIKQGNGGKIVGACSTAGFRPSGNTVAYSTSKWAVRGLTQAAALEFAPYNINVNAYAPGPVATNMWQEIDEALAQKHNLEPGVAFQRSIEARAALKRPQTPEDIANLVSFLVSDKARNITGQSVLCDAGISFS